MSSSTLHKVAIGLSIWMSAAATALAGTATYPDRPVKMIVPYAAGGNTDGIARLISARLSEIFNQQFVVENRSGASGAIAMDTVKNAEPDGYTLMTVALPQMAILPALSKVKYDPVTDYAPVSNVGSNPSVLTINAKIPVKTVAELVDWVKRSPERLTYVSGGPGSHMNLSMVQFLRRTGLDIAAVHLRGGSEPMNNVVAGHVPMGFMNASDVVQQASAGTVRALAVTSKQRIPQMPELPTMIESGFNYASYSWNGVIAPAATPRAIVELLSGEVQKAVRDPSFNARLVALGVAPIGNDPKAFADEIAADVKLYGEIVRGAGLGEK